MYDNTYELKIIIVNAKKLIMNKKKIIVNEEH